MWNIIEPGDPYDIRKYFLSQLGPWLPSFPVAKILWESIWSLYAYCRQQRLNAYANTLTNTSSSTSGSIQISRDGAAWTGQALLWGANQGADNAHLWRRQLQVLEPQIAIVPAQTDSRVRRAEEASQRRTGRRTSQKVRVGPPSSRNAHELKYSPQG